MSTFVLISSIALWTIQARLSHRPRTPGGSFGLSGRRLVVDWSSTSEPSRVWVRTRQRVRVSMSVTSGRLVPWMETPLAACVSPSGSSMTFDVGDKVVYPHHGAAIVERREVREAFGESKEYLVLRLAYGDLTLMVPSDNTDEVGLREVINDEEVEEVFAVLRKKDVRMPTNWSRRYKNHVEKLKSGDIYQVAEVVRNLSNRDKDKGLSAGEKRMLNRARQILVSELTFAIGVDEAEAEKKLDEALP